MENNTGISKSGLGVNSRKPADIDNVKKEVNEKLLSLYAAEIKKPLKTQNNKSYLMLDKK